MPIPVRETFASDRHDLLVQVTDDGSRTLLRSGTEDAFHSGCGAVSETRHVYLKGTGVESRLREKRATRVLEVGLGTSMALLMTLDSALRHDAELDYVAIETDWISARTLAFLEPHRWIDDVTILDRYIEFRERLATDVPPGSYPWDLDARRKVTIEVTDVRRWEPQVPAPFHGIYFDPFCPESAPELWTADCLGKMRRVIDPQGRLTTYSCSRPVRDALGESGWDVERVPGPKGGKRQVIVARPAARGAIQLDDSLDLR